MLSTNLQKQNDFTGQDFYIGLDVHKQSWYVTISFPKLRKSSRFGYPTKVPIQYLYPDGNG